MATATDTPPVIGDENRSPAKEQPIVQIPESPVENGHKRKISDGVVENLDVEAKKKKTEDIEKPTAPENEDTTVADDVVAEQAEEAKPEEAPEDVKESEEKKLLEGDAPETETPAATADANDEEDKKEADEASPVAN